MMMSAYRIVCTEQAPESGHPSQERIVAVGVSVDGVRASSRLTVEDVVHQMEQGDIFFTVGSKSGKVALVEKYWCHVCRGWHIRSHADAVTDNNLDSLRYCEWRMSA
jgi:hypothetical protein